MGIKMNDAFPSKWLKADDLQGRPVKAVIQETLMEDIGDDHKPVIYFRGKEKGLVCNKTNFESIAMDLGDDTDLWVGQTIELYPARTNYAGKTVPCVRVRMPAGVAPPPRQAAPAIRREEPPPNDGHNAPIDDDIPF